MDGGQINLFTLFMDVSLTLSGDVTGAIGEVTVQWHHSTTRGFTPSVATAIEDATSNVLTHPTQEALLRHYYRAVLTDSVGNTFTTREFVVGGALAMINDRSTSYNTVADADELAEEMPNLTAWAAANSTNKADALRMARFRIDRAHRYQGRKYDPNQRSEFPRLAYAGAVPPQQTTIDDSPAVAEHVWDWDTTTNAAVVPLDVKMAELFEANSILAADRDRIADAISNGLKSQSTGSLSETYDRLPTAPGGAPVLCRDAALLMSQYVLQSGRIQ